jgi:hypothetical protein
MSNVQSQNQQRRIEALSLVFDFGRWTLDIGLLLILCAGGALAQETKCTLKLAEMADAPELFGFRLGMTNAQVKARVPQVVFGPVDDFGVSKTTINPDFDPKIDKAGFVGVRSVSLDFLDGRLNSLWLGYDSTFKWPTIPDFVTGISQSLRLPDAWQPWKIRGQQLNCADFQLTLSFVAEGPSFHLIDATAERTIVARRQAKEEQDSAAEEAESSEIVADKRAKVYYSEGCQPEHEIKESDRVVFKTVEEAEKAGYKPARNCQ